MAERRSRSEGGLSLGRFIWRWFFLRRRREVTIRIWVVLQNDADWWWDTSIHIIKECERENFLRKWVTWKCFIRFLLFKAGAKDMYYTIIGKDRSASFISSNITQNEWYKKFSFNIKRFELLNNQSLKIITFIFKMQWFLVMHLLEKVNQRTTKTQDSFLTLSKPITPNLYTVRSITRIFSYPLSSL